MKKLNLKKTIQALGFNPQKVIRGYNYRSIFATDSQNKLWYFHIEDLRDSEPIIYRRTAESLEDYHGGSNLFDVESMAEAIGIKIHEPRTSRDYNKM